MWLWFVSILSYLAATSACPLLLLSTSTSCKERVNTFVKISIKKKKIFRISQHEDHTWYYCIITARVVKFPNLAFAGIFLRTTERVHDVVEACFWSNWIFF